MQPLHFNPPEVLSPYIAFYGIWDIDEGFCEPYMSPPIGLCGFIICLHHSINAQIEGKLFMKGKHCATGQVTTPMIGDLVGRNKIVMVFIHPCGLHQLFGIDMSLLTNTSMPLSELLGDEQCNILIGKISGAADNGKIIQVLNDLFLSQLPPVEIAPKFRNALEYIHQNKGKVSIKEIEANCYITSRSLERYFKEYVGLSPKEYVKIFRFKCLVNFINQNPDITWSTLCEQNGYYDQSHLTRYFTRYLKIKPTELVQLDMDFINYLFQEP